MADRVTTTLLRLFGPAPVEVYVALHLHDHGDCLVMLRVNWAELQFTLVHARVSKW